MTEAQKAFYWLGLTIMLCGGICASAAILGLRGIVRSYREPLRLDKWRKRVLSKTLHGVVEVRTIVVETEPEGQDAEMKGETK